MVFDGEQRGDKSILAGPEARLCRLLVPLVPQWLKTYHLTLSTVLWATLVLIFSFIASFKTKMMWVTSLLIILQYMTDLLDGAIGRSRKKELAMWRFYMAHFLDYFFFFCILMGYGFLLPQHNQYLIFFILALFGAYLLDAFLHFVATNRFRGTYGGVGPTEVRVLFVLLNTVIILFGREWWVYALRWVIPIATFWLFVVSFQTQKLLWLQDMRAMQKEKSCDD